MAILGGRRQEAGGKKAFVVHSSVCGISAHSLFVSPYTSSQFNDKQQMTNNQ
ncbi:MAG: hypothetical protein F6J86_41120 [Symploca sp. SIO1B1]|nr:hypothetical protein [Symploca sp. SIO1B1]